MNRDVRLVLAALLAIILGSSWYLRHPATSGRGHTVIFTEDGFSPAELIVARGDTVTFENRSQKYFWPASNLHPTHLLYPEFDPKEPVPAGQNWSFRFSKAGAWKYHDHLSPYFTGIIKATEADAHLPADDPCTNPQSLPCWQSSMIQAMTTSGIDAAFAVMATLYRTDPEFKNSCHYLAHNLGIAAYDLYLADRNSILTPQAAYCANGFYHGFMEALLTATGDVRKAQAFCDFVKEKLNGEAPDAALQCFHGIGHGAMDLAATTGIGVEADFIGPALRLCEEASRIPEERYRCASGVFNGIANFYITGEHGLAVNESDPLAVCRAQPTQYKESCYGNMNSVLLWLSNNDLARALAIASTISESAYRVSGTRYLASLAAVPLAKDRRAEAVRICRSSDEHIPCIEGLAHGLLEHGTPGREYEDALALCRSDALSDEERTACFRYVLRNLSGWYSAAITQEICAAVPISYRTFCPATR